MSLRLEAILAGDKIDGGFIYGTISMLCTDKIRTLYTRDSFVYDRFAHRQRFRFC